MKEIKDLNKWRDTVFIRRLNTTRNSILPKLICIFNTILMKIPLRFFFFVGREKIILKFIWKGKETKQLKQF